MNFSVLVLTTYYISSMYKKRSVTKVQPTPLSASN